MGKYFWREKNASIFIDKHEIIMPNKKELFVELVEKLEEKLQMINVIFEKEKRQEYLTKKNKTTQKGMSELVIQQKIGTRVIIDFLQLIYDICKLKEIQIYFSYKQTSQTKEGIYNSIKTSIKNLQKDLENNLIIIYTSIMSLIKILSISYNKIEEERLKIEEKEGSFFNGKIVITQ